MSFLDAASGIGGSLGLAANVASDLVNGNVGGLIDDAFALITQNRRKISILVPHVVVEETHVDDMMITDHPVETGAAISDHAFMQPQQVEMRCGYSDSKAGFAGYVNGVYAAFLLLQKSRRPFNVTTGKRRYKDMLIKSLVVQTDAHSENVLNLVVCMRQIILTKTSNAPLADPSVQADPATTASQADSGLRSIGAADSLPLMAQPGGGAGGFLPDNPTEIGTLGGSLGGTSDGLPTFARINFGG